jgi:hypothetical protein
MHTFSTRGSSAARRARVVGLERDHGPYRHAHRRERVLEGLELGEQRPLHPLARLVVGPEIVPERLDDVVGGDAEVRGAFLDRLEDGVQHAPDRAEGLVLALVEAALAVEVAEQLVRTVHDVNDHSNPRLMVRDAGPARSASPGSRTTGKRGAEVPGRRARFRDEPRSRRGRAA